MKINYTTYNCAGMGWNEVGTEKERPDFYMYILKMLFCHAGDIDVQKRILHVIIWEFTTYTFY